MNAIIRSIQVPKDVGYANVGFVIDGDMDIFRFNFISNIDTWGVVVIDPDGKITTGFSKNGISIENMKIVFDEYVLRVDIYDDPEYNAYQVYQL